ncbi:MAG TPA: CAP domain-containing protein [Thermomicrobiales bacterium]|nr:CAP domain-containing protein [Thermomicrobiales bacterium]
MTAAYALLSSQTQAKASTTTLPTHPATVSVDQLRADILRLVNEQRQAHALPPLVENDLLDRSAELKARDLIDKQYWSHYAPDGTNPWHFFDVAGYQYTLAGENLSEDLYSPESIVAGWMNSPEHRANILGAGYTETGIAAVYGDYLNLPVNLLVVQHFGRPLSH